MSSYLVLFISFYIATYKKMSKRKNAAKIAQKAERKMEKLEVPMMKETTERATHIVQAASTSMQNINRRAQFSD